MKNFYNLRILKFNFFRSLLIIAFLVFSSMVKLYPQIPGAYADGVHKDTKFIQAAFDSIANLGGGMVRFTQGYILPDLLYSKGIT